MLNPMDLSNRTILVTGASSGIGRETAILLSELGARVILVARDVQRLEQAMAALSGSGHRMESFDLTAFDEIPHWLKNLTADMGGFDGLVHSAGIQSTQAVRFLDKATVNEVMSINLFSSIALAKGFRQKGVHNPNSSIVFVASVMGLVGQAARIAYSASKGALISMSKSLALELAREHIRVNCVAPGVVWTEMTESLQNSVTPEQFSNIEAMHPLGIGQPLDVAHAIAFLLADTGRWITGSTLVVDGGYTAH
jgi:NAD(P)-dependent dehydrogenase (short-subunit alcohol dehydrogenase family)